MTHSTLTNPTKGLQQQLQKLEQDKDGELDELDQQLQALEAKNADLEKKFHQQSMMQDIDARRKLVWDIDKQLQEDAARPVIFFAEAGTCWWPRVHGIRIARNTIYNHWRFEDVWLDQ